MKSDKPLPPPKMVIETKPKTENTKPMPTIQIIGCGGAGTNRVKMFRCGGNVDLGVIDTSSANLLGIDSRISVDIIKDTDTEEGAGKIRKTKLDVVQKSINKLSMLKDLKNIVIIVHSFSGGSGSVIGPCVAKYLGLEKHPFIVVGIVDSASKHFTQNSINSLLTYQAIAEQNGIYIPVKIFHNKESRGNVDNQITQFIHDTVNMFTNPLIHELDVTDKQNHLRPYLVEDITGVYGFDVLTRDQTINIGEPVHSMLTVTPTADSYEFNIDSNLQFPGWSDSEWYVSIVGKSIDEEILSELQKTLDRFETITTKESSVVSGIRSKKPANSSGFVV